MQNADTYNSHSVAKTLIVVMAAEVRHIVVFCCRTLYGCVGRNADLNDYMDTAEGRTLYGCVGRNLRILIFEAAAPRRTLYGCVGRNHIDK